MVNSSCFFVSFYLFFNVEREIHGRQTIVNGSNVPVLTLHAGLNFSSKSGNEGAKPKLSICLKKIFRKNDMICVFLAY